MSKATKTNNWYHWIGGPPSIWSATRNPNVGGINTKIQEMTLNNTT